MNAFVIFCAVIESAVFVVVALGVRGAAAGYRSVGAFFALYVAIVIGAGVSVVARLLRISIKIGEC